MNSNGTPLPSAREAQASGMVSVQANCTCAAALALMGERAQLSGHTLEEIADAVLDRTIRFG